MPDKTIPKWQLIANTLATEINQKQLKGQLPIEPLLAERFTVNRHTVRRALQELEAQGLVRIEQGRGTFVQEDLIDYRMGKKERFSHSLAAQSLSGESKILSSKTIHANDDICNLLGIAKGSEVLQIDALDFVETQIVGVCTEYLPLPRFAGFTQRLFEQGVMSEAFRSVGIQSITRKFSRITARIPRPEVAVQLGQPKSQPVLYVESVYQDEEGQVIEYGITRFAANSIQLLITPET
jgi:GntR family phosphonate transport system transcriptional regulator